MSMISFDAYRAEVDYRRERVRRDWKGLRRRGTGVRNQIEGTNADNAS